MKRHKHAVFWILLFLCGAAAIWWVFYVPYKPEKIFNAIPAHAAFITTHKHVADRWDDLADNPLTLSLLHSAGLNAEEVHVLTEDPGFRSWLERLASDTVVVSYVPTMKESGKPAWVLASWLGGDSQVMRLAMFFKAVEHLEQHQTRTGRNYWIVKDAALQDDLQLAITFTEGILLGCVSENPGDIEEVLETMDGHYPSIVEAGVLNADAIAEDVTDRGWLRPRDLFSKRWRSDASLSYEVYEVGDDRLSGRIVISDSGVVVTNNGPLLTDELGRVLGDLPMAVVAADPSLFESALDPVASEILSDLRTSQGAETIAAALVGGDFSGRIARLFKVPSLLFAVRIQNEEGAIASINNAMDRLNAQYKWGLIRRGIPMEKRTLYVIETTTNNAYKHLAPEERVAYAVCGNWLLLASNRMALLKLIARYDDEVSVAEAANGRWREGLAEPASPLYAWLDLKEARKPLRLAVKMYEIQLLHSDPFKGKPVRERLDLARAWIETLAPFGVCRVWVRSGTRDTEIQFEMGE